MKIDLKNKLKNISTEEVEKLIDDLTDLFCADEVASNTLDDDEYDPDLGMSMNEAIEKLQKHTEKCIAHVRERNMNQCCAACGGPFHIATGHCWSRTLVLCYRCTMHYKSWLKARESSMSKPWRKNAWHENAKCEESFTEAALTSIGANRMYCGYYGTEVVKNTRIKVGT